MEYVAASFYNIKTKGQLSRYDGMCISGIKVFVKNKHIMFDKY